MGFTPKHILVATDFSPFADQAVDAAIELAKRFDGHLTLLHVIPLSSYATYASGIEGQAIAVAELQTAVRAVAKKSMTAELKRLEASNLKAEVSVLDGPPAPEICAFAAEHHVDLIVIGSHGYTGVKRFLMGSVAENVVRHSPGPVLVVRDAVHPVQS